MTFYDDTVVCDDIETYREGQNMARALFVLLASVFSGIKIHTFVVFGRFYLKMCLFVE